MKFRKMSLILVVVFAAILPRLALATEKAPVFPGAKGFGIYTPAGRGGKIIRITNLNNEGQGSLREALTTEGPRIVVFEVGGVIDLEKKDIRITEPFLTIAGQTAPSPGITIIRGGISIRTHDVLIQHIRVRPGDAGEAKGSGWEPEVTTWGPSAYNIVIDHCSISWAVDENLSVSGPFRAKCEEDTSRNVTVSNCIIAEGLNDSSHHQGPHSKGSLVHDFCTNIAIIGNLFAHNMERNPMFKPNSSGIVVNNLIYNPGEWAIHMDWPVQEDRWRKRQSEPARVSVVGNVLLCGPSTRRKTAIVAGVVFEHNYRTKERTWVLNKGAEVYLEDNIGEDRKGKKASNTSGNIHLLKKKPIWPEGLQALPSSQVITSVLKNAGARPKDRDYVDQRIVKEFSERKGRIIDSQDDVGGYPQTEITRRELNIPEENVDEWLAQLAVELE